MSSKATIPIVLQARMGTNRKRVQIHDAEGDEVPNKAWCYFMDPRKIEKLSGALIPDGIWAI